MEWSKASETDGRSGGDGMVALARQAEALLRQRLGGRGVEDSVGLGQRVRVRGGRESIEVVAECPFTADRFRRRLLPAFADCVNDIVREGAHAAAPRIDVIIEAARSEAHTEAHTGAGSSTAGRDAGERRPRSPGATTRARGDAPRGPVLPRRERTPWRRLDDFVVGASNRLAHGAAVRLADAPEGDALRMVFFHGVSGAGKSHLLEGLASRYLQTRPGARVRHATAEAFIDGYIRAVRGGSVESFRRQHRRLHLLCIDDVHAVAGKEGTQVELIHTLDALEQLGCRIAMASDAPPEAMTAMNKALSSRFAGGAVVRVGAPDADLRQRLLACFAARHGLNLSPEAVSRLESELVRAAARRHSEPTPRDIEGLITQVAATVTLLPDLMPRGDRDGGAIGLAIVEQTLRQRDPGSSGPAAARRPVSVAAVMQVVTEELGVPLVELKGKGRHQRVVLARALTVYLARRVSTRSFPEIAMDMGRPGHSFAVMAYQRLTGQIQRGETVATGCRHDGMSLAALCELLEARISGGR